MSDRDPMMAQAPRPRRIGRWVFNIVLVLSLSLNLLILGLVAGAAWRGKEIQGALRRPPPPRAAMMIGGMVFRDLDRAERRRVRELAEGEYGSVFERRRAEVDALLSLIGAEELDLERLQATLSAQRLYSNQVEATLEGAWVERLQTMNARQRKALVVRIKERMAKGPRPGSPKHPPPHH